MLEDKILVLEGIEVGVKREKVLRYLGYRRREASGEVEEILTREIDNGCNLIAPQAVYSQRKVEKQQGGTITLTNGLSLDIGSMLQEWQGSEYLGVAICTIGTALENRVDELLAEEDPVSAVVLDSVGSVAVEAIADEVNYLVCCRERRVGNNLGPRTSPGYGKWDLTDQRLLFSLFPSDRINIRLNQQCMMIPRKSCSFCVGIGKGLNCKFNPCRRCDREHCDFRRSK